MKGSGKTTALTFLNKENFENNNISMVSSSASCPPGFFVHTFLERNVQIDSTH
jgi:hypothetical protein